MKFSGTLWYVPNRIHDVLNAYNCFQSVTSSQKDLPIPNQLASEQAPPIPSVTSVITDSFSPNPFTNTSDYHFTEPDLNKDEITWLNLAERDELTQSLDVCVQQWRNASPE
jgi:hypothetical protein